MKRIVRGRWDWRAALFSVVVVGVVIGGSIGLVRFRNRDRGSAQAIIRAADALRAIPDSVVAAVFDPEAYKAAATQFSDAVTDNALPVESLRAFYHRYALWARDGSISTDELREIGLYFGVVPALVTGEPDSGIGAAAADSQASRTPPFGEASTGRTGDSL